MKHSPPGVVQDVHRARPAWSWRAGILNESRQSRFCQLKFYRDTIDDVSSVVMMGITCSKITINNRRILLHAPVIDRSPERGHECRWKSIIRSRHWDWQPGKFQLASCTKRDEYNDKDNGNGSDNSNSNSNSNSENIINDNSKCQLAWVISLRKNCWLSWLGVLSILLHIRCMI